MLIDQSISLLYTTHHLTLPHTTHHPHPSHTLIRASHAHFSIFTFILQQLNAELNRVIKNGRGLKDPPSILAPDVARTIIFACVHVVCFHACAMIYISTY